MFRKEKFFPPLLVSRRRDRLLKETFLIWKYTWLVLMLPRVRKYPQDVQMEKEQKDWRYLEQQREGIRGYSICDWNREVMMPFGIRTLRPICEVNLCSWFISLKRHHNAEVEQMLKTESVAMMAFSCTFVRLSFLFFFPLSWADGPCCSCLALDSLGRRGRNMEDVSTWSVKLQIWAGGKISLREQYTFPPFLRHSCILQLMM